MVSTLKPTTLQGSGSGACAISGKQQTSVSVMLINGARRGLWDASVVFVVGPVMAYVMKE